MATFGRMLQMVGLVVVPIALFYGIEGGGEKGVAQRELMILAAGAATFMLGTFLARSRR